MVTCDTLQIVPGICVCLARGDIGTVTLLAAAILCLVERRLQPDIVAVPGQALVAFSGLDGDVCCRCCDGNRYQNKCADCRCSATHSQDELRMICKDNGS